MTRISMSSMIKTANLKLWNRISKLGLPDEQIEKLLMNKDIWRARKSEPIVRAIDSYNPALMPKNWSKSNYYRKLKENHVPVEKIKKLLMEKQQDVISRYMGDARNSLQSKDGARLRRELHKYKLGKIEESVTMPDFVSKELDDYFRFHSFKPGVDQEALRKTLLDKNTTIDHSYIDDIVEKLRIHEQRGAHLDPGSASFISRYKKKKSIDLSDYSDLGRYLPEYFNKWKATDMTNNSGYPLYKLEEHLKELNTYRPPELDFKRLKNYTPKEMDIGYKGMKANSGFHFSSTQGSPLWASSMQDVSKGYAGPDGYLMKLDLSKAKKKGSWSKHVAQDTSGMDASQIEALNSRNRITGSDALGDNPFYERVYTDPEFKTVKSISRLDKNYNPVKTINFDKMKIDKPSFFKKLETDDFISYSNPIKNPLPQKIFDKYPMVTQGEAFKDFRSTIPKDYRKVDYAPWVKDMMK